MYAPSQQRKLEAPAIIGPVPPVDGAPGLRSAKAGCCDSNHCCPTVTMAYLFPLFTFTVIGADVSLLCCTRCGCHDEDLEDIGRYLPWVSINATGPVRK